MGDKEKNNKNYFKKSLHAELVKVVESLDKTKDQMDNCAEAMIKCGQLGGISELISRGTDMRFVAGDLNGWIVSVSKIISMNLESIKNDKQENVN